MTVSQQTLDGEETTVSPTGRTLTLRQQLAWIAIRHTYGGLTAEQVGELLGAREPWQKEAGLGVLRSKTLGPMVIRRKTGKWEVRDPADRLAQPAPELPGSSFEDIFR